MGLPTYGFGGGREDAWEADDATYWGPEVFDMTKVDSFDEMVNRDKRWRGQNGDADYDLEQPLAASHQSLIYVNPEGPYASGDPMASARDIRITFTRMAMNDEETVALIAGGHAFGKSHGMVKADRIGAPPEIAAIEEMGLGWHNPEGTGNAEFTMTNGIEGSWTQNPTQWDNSSLGNLLGLEWEQTRSPAGALQWTPVNADAPRTPDAHIAGKSHALMMMTSDIALKVDPVYRPICERFLKCRPARQPERPGGRLRLHRCRLGRARAGQRQCHHRCRPHGADRCGQPADPRRKRDAERRDDAGGRRRYRRHRAMGNADHRSRWQLYLHPQCQCGVHRQGGQLHLHAARRQRH